MSETLSTLLGLLITVGFFGGLLYFIKKKTGIGWWRMLFWWILPIGYLGKLGLDLIGYFPP